MCYTGLGEFENHMGDCNVKNSGAFKVVMGIDACTVCQGYPFDINEYPNKDELYSEKELHEIAKKARKDGLIY